MHESMIRDPLLETKWLEELDRTPFLKRCREGTVSREEMKQYVAQQYHYSSHFTRYLCALISNLSQEGDRRELTENLMEEMGFIGKDSIPHSLLYREMLKQLEVNPDDYPILNETELLIDTMYESCRSPDPLIGLGALCLGAEAIVPHLYSQVIQGFESLGEKRDRLTFFTVHVECDDDHALTMRKIIQKELTHDVRKSVLRAAARRAIYARIRFFEALSQGEIGEVYAVI